MNLLLKEVFSESALLESLYVYGCGGVGAEIAEKISKDNSLELGGFIDDNSVIKECLGFKSQTLDELLAKKNPQSFKAIISVGEPIIREKISLKLKDKGVDEVTIDFSSHCDYEYSVIGRGCLLHEDSYVSVNTKIGNCCMINKGVIVGHDNNIGNYAVLSPRVTLGGNVTIGERVFIGTGALIKNGVRIGNDVIIGMGSVVLHDVEDGVVIVGNPAKVIRRNDTHRVFMER